MGDIAVHEGSACVPKALGVETEVWQCPPRFHEQTDTTFYRYLCGHGIFSLGAWRENRRTSVCSGLAMTGKAHAAQRTS